MAGPKIVLWRPMYDPAGHGLLEQASATVEVVDSPSEDDVIAAIPGAKALWVRTPERVTEAILDAADSLVVISTSGFGTDNIPIDAATGRGILAVNHPGFGRIPVAEHSLMLILAALKQLVWSDSATRDGDAWTTRSGLRIFELEGKTVGIVGVGYIGAELAQKLRLGFRCRVLGYDPFTDPRLSLTAGVEMCASLDDLLGQSQILCICAELTEANRNMIGPRELARLPEGAIVVNAARGRLLDPDALVAALDNGPVSAAGLDVAYPEPLSGDHPLLRHPAVTLTPHTAGLSAETSARLARSAADQIMTALNGDMPAHPLNAGAWNQPTSRRPGG